MLLFLAFPYFDFRFHLDVNAGNDAIGIILNQIHDNSEIVTAYAGRKLSAHQQHYSATVREALAVVAGIKHFQSYLYCRAFTVHTDRNALRWLLNVKDSHRQISPLVSLSLTVRF